jgi:hypothetical protein
MKGIVMASGLISLSMGVSFGLMFYISHEQLRQATQFSLKQALSETMIELDTLDPMNREGRALSLFIDNFILRKLSSVQYTVDLMGFNEDPLAMRVRIQALDQGSVFDVNVMAEETMIEVSNEK